MKILGGIVFQVLKLNEFILFSLLSLLLIAEVRAESVKFVFLKENKLETIFLFPGRVSLLSLPCPITKALVGSPNDIKAEIDKISKTEAHILLKKWGAQPSNLILKCKAKVFLFSLIPAKKSHYDYVKVLSHKEGSLKVKSALPNSPSPKVQGLREKDFKIQKILDFSWEDKK